MTISRIRKPKRRAPRSHSVSGGRPTRPAATRPNSVAGPAFITTALPRPLITEVLLKTAVTASVSPSDGPGSASACFLLVRGLRKVQAVLLWFALAHNLMRAVGLRRAAGAAG